MYQYSTDVLTVKGDFMMETEEIPRFGAVAKHIEDSWG
jgi:hypothetical protein